MGLDTLTKQMIIAISENDILKAKKAALNALNADETKKNKYFVSKYKQVLTSEGASMIELPYDLKNILVCEDLALSFKENRFYITNEREVIATNIFRMSKVSEKLMEIMIPYRNATLLCGEPGTGKTLFGKYVAHQMNLPFVYMNFSQIIDSYLGATSKNIVKAFAFATSHPCILMLDEIDAIGANRANGNGTEKEMGRVTITLLQEFDKLPNNVIVIAATNRLDLLDEALISRFSQKAEISKYSKEENFEMIKKFLSDVNIKFEDSEIEHIAEQEKSQREIIDVVVRKIAEKIEDTES